MLGGISLAIDGPGKTEIETTNQSNDDCKVLYIPQLPGKYMLHIQYDGNPIMGSPYKVLVQGNCT